MVWVLKNGIPTQNFLSFRSCIWKQWVSDLSSDFCDFFEFYSKQLPISPNQLFKKKLLIGYLRRCQYFANDKQFFELSWKRCNSNRPMWDQKRPSCTSIRIRQSRHNLFLSRVSRSWTRYRNFRNFIVENHENAILWSTQSGQNYVVFYALLLVYDVVNCVYMWVCFVMLEYWLLHLYNEDISVHRRLYVVQFQLFRCILYVYTHSSKTKQ